MSNKDEKDFITKAEVTVKIVLQSGKIVEKVFDIDPMTLAVSEDRPVVPINMEYGLDQPIEFQPVGAQGMTSLSITGMAFGSKHI
jgi:hypothetical protein